MRAHRAFGWFDTAGRRRAREGGKKKGRERTTNHPTPLSCGSYRRADSASSPDQPFCLLMFAQPFLSGWWKMGRKKYTQPRPRWHKWNVTDRLTHTHTHTRLTCSCVGRVMCCNRLIECVCVCSRVAVRNVQNKICIFVRARVSPPAPPPLLGVNLRWNDSFSTKKTDTHTYREENHLLYFSFILFGGIRNGTEWGEEKNGPRKSTFATFGTMEIGFLPSLVWRSFFHHLYFSSKPSKTKGKRLKSYQTYVIIN